MRNPAVELMMKPLLLSLCQSISLLESAGVMMMAGEEVSDCSRCGYGTRRGVLKAGEEARMKAGPVKLQSFNCHPEKSQLASASNTCAQTRIKAQSNYSSRYSNRSLHPFYSFSSYHSDAQPTAFILLLHGSRIGLRTAIEW